MPSGYQCANCNAGLYTIYNSQQDQYNPDSIWSLPDDFETLPYYKQKDIVSAMETLKITLDKLSSKKRERIITAIEDKRHIIILLCPICKTYYDNRNDFGNETIPAKKPDKKVVSDDLTSIEEATSNDFDYQGGSMQDIYVYSDDLKDQFYENKSSVSESRLKQKEEHRYNIPYVKKELERIKGDSMKELVDVHVDIGA